MVRLDVVGQEGFNDVTLTLSVWDDALMYTRAACDYSGLNARECSSLLQKVTSIMKSFVNKEGVGSPIVHDLLVGHSMNAILLRNEGIDQLSAEVKASMETSVNHDVDEDKMKPMIVFIHQDNTNNLGDMWSLYIFHHYAHKLGYRGKIRYATSSKDSFVTAVGSTLQWLFVDIPAEKASEQGAQHGIRMKWLSAPPLATASYAPQQKTW